MKSCNVAQLSIQVSSRTLNRSGGYKLSEPPKIVHIKKSNSSCMYCDGISYGYYARAIHSTQSPITELEVPLYIIQEL